MLCIAPNALCLTLQCQRRMPVATLRQDRKVPSHPKRCCIIDWPSMDAHVAARPTTARFQKPTPNSPPNSLHTSLHTLVRIKSSAQPQATCGKLCFSAPPAPSPSFSGHVFTHPQTARPSSPLAAEPFVPGGVLAPSGCGLNPPLCSNEPSPGACPWPSEPAFLLLGELRCC
jgi:hypothetical protein